MPNQILIILDCPNESVFEILDEMLVPYYDRNIDKNKKVTSIIHLGPLLLIKNSKY